MEVDESAFEKDIEEIEDEENSSEETASKKVDNTSVPMEVSHSSESVAGN